MVMMGLWEGKGLGNSRLVLAVLLLQGARDARALSSNLGNMGHWRRGARLGDRDRLLIIDGRFGIETLRNDDFGQLRVLGGSVAKTFGTDVVRCVVRNEVELLVVDGGDAEGLLQETVLTV